MLKPSQGGLAVPDIGLYYHVAILASIMQWWNLSNKLGWQTEQIGVKIPLSELALLPGNKHFDTLDQNYKVFQGIWHKYKHN